MKRLMSSLLLLVTTPLVCSIGSVSGAEIPPNAVQYLPLLVDEQRRQWPDHPDAATLAAQVEQETCISLKHKKCWSPTVTLQTSREYGFGFGQVTVAYNADGSERFNTWKDLRAKHAALRDWTWENRFDPRLQIRALVLYDHQIYRTFAKHAATPLDQLAFTYAGYNGGAAGTLKEIRLCAGKAGCDPRKWFGNVEHTSAKSRKPWQGYGKSAFDINREYVHSILYLRVEKYRPYFGLID